MILQLALVVLSIPDQHTVLATREGLIGHRTADGHVITSTSVFVALPARSALGRWVTVEYAGRRILARVRDVGPHNTTDPYWTSRKRPAAELGLRLGPMQQYGPPKNKAGIDLSDGAWDALGIPRARGIVRVRWHFTTRKES